MVVHVLLNVKTALLSAANSKKLELIVLPTLSEKKLTRNPSPPASKPLSLTVSHLPHPPRPLLLPQSQSLLTSKKSKAKIASRSSSLKSEPLSNGSPLSSNYLTNSLIV
jgi:hypothetical protein